MAKTNKKPKTPWWSPHRLLQAVLPSGTWTSRRQWLMQTGSALVVVFVSRMLGSGPALRPQQQLQSKGEIAPHGKVTHKSITATDGFAIRLHDTATVTRVAGATETNVRVATATATNVNVIRTP